MRALSSRQVVEEAKKFRDFLSSNRGKVDVGRCRITTTTRGFSTDSTRGTDAARKFLKSLPPEHIAALDGHILLPLTDEQADQRLRNNAVVRRTLPFIEQLSKMYGRLIDEQDHKDISCVADHNHDNSYIRYILGNNERKIDTLFNESNDSGLNPRDFLRAVDYPDQITNKRRDNGFTVSDANAALYRDFGNKLVHLDAQNNKFGELPNINDRNALWAKVITERKTHGRAVIFCGCQHLHDFGNKYSGEKVVGIDYLLEQCGITVRRIHLFDRLVSSQNMRKEGMRTISEPEIVRDGRDIILKIPEIANENMAYFQTLALFHFREIAAGKGIIGDKNQDDFAEEKLKDFARKCENLCRAGLICCADSNQIDFQEPSPQQEFLRDDFEEITLLFSEKFDNQRDKVRDLSHGPITEDDRVSFILESGIILGRSDGPAGRS